MNYTWSQQEVDKLLLLIKDENKTYNLKELSKIMGRGRWSVAAKAKELGYKPEKRGKLLVYDQNTIELVLNLKKSGLRNITIAKETGFGPRKVSYIIKRYGSYMSDNEWNEQMELKLIECIKSGKDIQEIKKIFNKTTNFIKSVISNRIRTDKDLDLIEFKRNLNNSKERIIKSKLLFAKKRCLQNSWKFELSYDYILYLLNKQDEKCFYTNIPITFKRYDDAIFSLDRVDSSKGYTKDNTVICCWAINKMKQDLTLKDFYNFCELVIKFKKI